MSQFNFKTNPDSNVLKFQQLVDAINDAINSGLLKGGQSLPSVNQLIRDSNLSRDTIFKAYAELKRRGIVQSIPNKGYFVARDQNRIFLFLDTFKAYKEVLYNSFKNSLSEDVVVDLNFHHYNIDVFESTIQNNKGKFNTFIIMNFDHPKVPEILSGIDEERLLVIDWKINSLPGNSKVYQDFGEAVYRCLEAGRHLLQKYRKFICVYPQYTYHPYESVENAKKFCSINNLLFEVVKDVKDIELEEGNMYFVFEDIDLALILEEANSGKFRLGKDVGILSYNDTPMKKFISGGITVISTDFKEMGKKAAAFAAGDEVADIVIPTKLIIRESL
jgi:DNA-binding transcriptional regulator YhcF (GntR family)